MNRTQLEYALTVYKYLNFSEASRQLFVTQSALSKQIASLESELGFQIFERTKRYVRLTPGGIIFCTELIELMASFDKVIEKARNADLGLSGNIEIGVLDGLNMPIQLLSIFNEFEIEYPNINLNLSRASFKNLRDKLQEGIIDLAITLSFEASDQHEWETIEILKENDVVSFSTFHPLARLNTLSFEDLSDQIFITIQPKESQYAMDHSLEYIRSQGVVPKSIKYAESLESLMLMLESGIGIGIVSNHTRFYEHSSIKIVDMYALKELAPPYVGIIAAWKRAISNPSVSHFIKLLESSVSLHAI